VRVGRLVARLPLFADADSTVRPLGGPPLEQALVLDTANGLAAVIGCAHAGMDRVAEAAGRLTGVRIHPLIRGFHLLYA
jgi:7,8-dihydropterin-6-yl-methyl-4-(beta-D-ribofuranosyl)aminobenzene 5'-phosphate synthase